MFSRTVLDHWFPHGEPTPGAVAGGNRIVVDPSLPPKHSIMLLKPVGGDGVLSVTPDRAAQLGLTADGRIEDADLTAAMHAAGLALNGPDHLFYFPSADQAALRSEQPAAATRQLTAGDGERFAAFTAGAPEDDLDEAFVELDHWLVYGTFVADRLAAVASMYPWQDTALADLGVITLPAFRGRGLARQTVRALSAHALGLGYEPQYRCQLDNRASVALAHSSGLTPFGTWDVIHPDSEP